MPAGSYYVTNPCPKSVKFALRPEAFANLVSFRLVSRFRRMLKVALYVFAMNTS